MCKNNIRMEKQMFLLAALATEKKEKTEAGYPALSRALLGALFL